MRSLKFILGMVVFIFLFLIHQPFSQTEETSYVQDCSGERWQEMDQANKYEFISGFLLGSGTFHVKIKEGLEILSIIKDDKKEIVIESIKNILDKLELFEITDNQLVEGVDTFYKDFSNRKIRIVDAIYVVKMQIKGENPELIDTQIRYLRMQPIDEKTAKEAFKNIATYKEGKVSKENLLKNGLFISEDGKMHSLFCYGRYK